MKNTKLITMLCLGALIACSPSKKGLEPTSEQVSPRERLIENLRATPQKGIMFGHHDDTVYGIGWEFDEGGSDVQKVCGDYPAVISFDLGEIELGGDKSLDKVPFEKIRKEIINQYNRGGLVSLSWHPRNPKTGGDAWDVSDHAVVKSILPEGENYEKFQSWLGKVNDFILSLKTSDGTKIPVLFRPWHEHTGSWFWWGQNLCTTDEYKALCIIRKTKCFDFWERNVLFPKTKRSFFRTPTPLPCPFPLNFSLLIITKKFGNFAKNRYICIV